MWNLHLVLLNSIKNSMKQPAHIRPCMPKTHPKHMGWHQCTQIIFHWSSGYDRDMTGIYMSDVCISLSCTLGGLPGLPGALCRCTPAPWPLADLLCFSNRETGNKRLGQWSTYSTYDLCKSCALLQLMIYLWFTYDLLIFYLCFTYDLPMIYLFYLQLTYANHVLYFSLIIYL